MNIPNFDELNHLPKSLESIIKQIQQAARSNKTSALTSAFQSLREPSNSTLSQIANLAQLPDSVGKRLSEQLSSVQGQTSLLKKADIIGGVANYSAMLLVPKIFEKISFPDDRLSGTIENFSNLYNSHLTLANLWDSLIKSNPRLNIESLAAKSSFEFLNHINLVETLIDEDDRDIEQTSLLIEKDLSRTPVEVLLPRIKAEDLIEMWEGATYALKSKHPDYRRHSIISLRELMTQLLQRLAPTKDVIEWAYSIDPSNYRDLLYEDNKEVKPTRKGRTSYICRLINNGKYLEEFIGNNIQAVVDIMKDLNDATHRPTIPYNHQQLESFKHRAEGSINFLISIVEPDAKN